MNEDKKGIKDTQKKTDKDFRLAKIEEFQLNPEKVIFETLEELQSIIPIIQKVQSDKDLQKIVGQDGKTPEKGTDYLTDEELQELENFILERLPQEGIDYPTMQNVWQWITEEVNSAINKIPKPKDGKTPTKKEVLSIVKEFSDEIRTPELTGKQIIKKIKEVKTELKINFKDILGSRPILKDIKNTKERIETLEEKIKKVNIEVIQTSGGVQKQGATVDLSGYQETSEKGVADGYASLDSSGKVPASQLPSFVDDILEYDTKDDFSATGETGKIYVAKDTNKTYRWSGSDYIEISSSEVDSIFGRTGAIIAQNGDYNADQITETDNNKILTSTERTNISNNTEKVSADGSIDTHSDVDTSTTAPINGQVLKWDGSKWKPQDEATGGGGDMLKSTYDTDNSGVVDNAEKVNSHTVEVDVPSDAVFTDTTYSVGDDGLTEKNFTSTLKTKLDDLQTNANHTGEVTGDSILTLDPTAISNKPASAVTGTEQVLILDVDGNLKKTSVVEIANKASNLKQDLEMNNKSITGVNVIKINDTGKNEGIYWEGQDHRIDVTTTSQGGRNAMRFKTNAGYPAEFETDGILMGNSANGTPAGIRDNGTKLQGRDNNGDWVDLISSGSGSAGAFELSGTVIKETGLTGTSTNDFVVGADDPYNTTGGARMFFDASKRAFRAGYYNDTKWNEENIGYYSTALNSNTIASGNYSTALGYYTTANAYYSTALGYYTTANAYSSTIVGKFGQTDTDTAFAVAYGAFGEQNTVGAGLKFEVKQDGRIKMNNLPTSSTGLTAGDLWNNGGVINIV